MFGADLREPLNGPDATALKYAELFIEGTREKESVRRENFCDRSQPRVSPIRSHLIVRRDFIRD